MTKKNLTIKVSVTGMLLALYFIFDRLIAINLPANKYNLSFIPVIIAAYYLGPVYALAVGGLGDLLGALIMPFGAYFPGFTVIAMLNGLGLGLILYKKLTIPRIALGVAFSQIICGFILNTLNLSFYYIANGINKYGGTVLEIIPAIYLTRLSQAIIYIVMETAF